MALFGPPVAAEHDAPDASAAEAYGLLVDGHLLPAPQAVKHGPVAWSSQDYPPLQETASTANVGQAGPVPEGGELVNQMGAMVTTARADDSPSGDATAQAGNVRLLTQDGTPLITAELARAEAHSDCDEDPNATGTLFRNLVINGQAVSDTPAPNTVHALPIGKVILNEQRPASDGRGIVVNAIHVISTTEGDPLFRGDIIVAHAMSTVHCQDGPGSTGAENTVQIVKDVSSDTTAVGQELTYTATVTNNDTADCLLNRVVDHLPPGFAFVSTAGDLGDVAATADRPGGGVDVTVGNGVNLAAGESVTQTFVVKVGDTVANGTYFNNVEVFCANLGEFVKGLDAPVTVGAAGTGETTTTTSTTSTTTTLPPDTGPTATLPDDNRELPATGVSGPMALAGLVGAAALVLAFMGLAVQRAAASKRDL